MTLTFALLLSAAASAAPGSLSYEEAIALAEENNPSIRRSEATVSSAEGGLTAARGAWEPRLTLGGRYSVEADEQVFGGVVPITTFQNNTGWSAGLSQSLPTGTSWSLDLYDGATRIEDANFGNQAIEGSSYFGSGATVSLTQQLLKGYRTSWNMASVLSARSTLDQAEAALLQQRQEVVSSVASAYWDLVYATQALETARDAVEVAGEERRVVQAQVEAGNMAPVEVTRVEAALARAQLAQIQAEASRAAASDALALLLGQDPGAPLTATTVPGDVPPGLDIDASRATTAALEGNPGLVALRRQVEQAELQLANARHGLLPTLAVTGSMGSKGTDLPKGDDPDYVPSNAEALAELVRRDFPSWSLGANFSVPLGMKAERGAVQSRAAALTQAQIELEEAERSIALQVATHVRTLDSARRQIQLAELNLQLARETLAAEQARRDAGRAIEKDVLEAQRLVHEAEVERVRTRTEFRKAMVELEALQGKL